MHRAIKSRNACTRSCRSTSYAITARIPKLNSSVRANTATKYSLNFLSCSDVIGIVKSVGDVTELNTRDGRQMEKRDIALVDTTNHQVLLTLWGDMVS